MRLSNLLVVAASAAAIATAAACGSDSTGPSSQTPAQLAAHWDSLYADAAFRNDSANKYENRMFLLSVAEVAAALGASPSSFSVTTAGGTEQWKAYEVEEVPSSGDAADSLFALVAYRDADAHDALVVEYDSAGAIQFAGLVSHDTLDVVPSGGSGTTSLASSSGNCATPSSSLTNPVLGSLGIASCTLAKFTTSVSLNFPSTTGVDAALASLTFSGASINGVRAVDASGTVRRVKGLLPHVRLSRVH